MYVYIHMCVFVYVYIDTRCFWVGRVVLLWGWSRKAFPSPCQWAAYYMKFTSRFHAFHFIQQSTASKSARKIFTAIVLQTHHVHFVRHSPETLLTFPLLWSLSTLLTLSLLYKTPIGSKLTTTDTQTVTESSKHSDRINISFYGHKRDPYQIKGALLQSFNHPCIHTYIS